MVSKQLIRLVDVLIIFTFRGVLVKMSQDGEESNRVYEKDPDPKAQKKKSNFDFLNKISVEPCIALFAFGWSLYRVQASTLYIQKTCKVGSFFFGNQTFSIEVRI